MKKLAVFMAVLAVGLGTLSFGIVEFRQAQASYSWPSVPGVIVSSEAHMGEECVTFSYSIAGQRRTATTVFFHEEGTKIGDRSPSCRDDVVERYPSGKNVQVRYNPQNPAHAILEPGPNLGTFFVLAVGAAFTLPFSWLVWKGIGARFRIRRRTSSLQVPRIPGQEADAHIFADSVTSSLVTPSEVVAINGAQFAARTVGSNILLLDGSTEVSARELLLAELKAAILAHEKVGTIRLEVLEIPKRQLYIVPVGARFAWPSPSTESRLEFHAREEASAVVRRWLAQSSHVGWERAAEKVHVPLVLRRAAVVSQTGLKRRYILVDRGTEAAAAQSLSAVSALLERCELERPAVWNLLSAAIEAAVEEQSADATSAYSAADPWYDESASDVKSVPGLKLSGDVGTPWWQVLIWGTILWSLLATAAYYASPSGRIALAVGLVVAAFLFTAVLKWGRSWARAAATRWPRLRPVTEAAIDGDRRKTALIFVPVCALLISLLYANAEDPRAVAGAAAGMLMGGMWLLKKKSGEAITEHVIEASKSAATAVATSKAAAGAETAPFSSLAPQPAVLPFDIEIIRPTDLPAVSDNSRARLQAIRERGPRLRRLYGRAALILAAGSMATSLAAWQLLDAEKNAGTFPWFTAVLFVVTLLILSGARSENSIMVPIFLMARYALRYVRGGAALERNRWERDITPIRPVVAPLLGFGWAVFTLLRRLTYMSGATLAKWVPVTLSAGVLSWYVFGLRRSRKTLESQYPVYPALNLLALRVFKSASRDRFVDLLDLWHWFGPLYRLDGPDTAGGKSSDVLAFVTGRLDKAITEDEAELEQAIRKFSQTRDSQLRFAFNSLQCNDRIWKEALQNMLDRADVVVMDLSGLTEGNRGCAYEISKLVNETPLERFLLLINDETDIVFLQRLLSESTSAQNITASPRKLRLFHLGTQPGRKDNESVYEWQRRSTTPIDAERLIGLLCDAACTRRPAQLPITIPWTRPGYRSAPFA